MENQRVLVVDVSVVDEKGVKHPAGRSPITIHQNEKYGVLTINELVLHVPTLKSEDSNRVILNQDAYMDIMQSTAKRVLGIEDTGVDNKIRKAGGVFYRQMMFFFMYHTVTITTGKIGKMFQKNHATVIHGKNRFTERLVTDKRTHDIAQFFADSMLELGYAQPKNILETTMATNKKLWR
jgi:hypothetical protein